ncbi:MAG: hypothetical protein HY320_13365 [Armatimonadetes bacterium]|nr:hypothetical protein [Armatimonadota bacterium]
MILQKMLRYWFRQLFCPHKNRILDMIFREPVTYTRRAQYYCPDCQRSWASWKLPDGI